MSIYRLSAFADEADKNLGKQIAALRANQIGQIEIRGVNGKNVSTLSNEEAVEAREMLRGNGITVWSMGSPFGKYPIAEPVGKHIEAFKRGLEICELLGTKRIRMFSFFMPEGKDPADYRAKVLDNLDQMLTLAEQAGIRLCHENEKGIYGDDDARCVDLMESLGDRMGFIFDPSNFLQCGVRPKEAFPKLEGYIDYMHIKDAILETGAVVPSGEGDGDIAWILEQLAARDSEITLSIEPHLTVFEGLSGLQSEALAHKYHYPDTLTAFYAASDALKSILTGLKYESIEGGNGTWKR